MRFSETAIRGVWVIELEPIEDARGRFARIWCAREFEEHGIPFNPVQENMAASKTRGTVRGVHYQVAPALEAKLIRCTRGSMFDVAVDVRPDSPTFGQWFGTELTPETGRMLYIPEHCGHSYQTLEDNTEMQYMASAPYTPSAARGVR
jgi:dTDP-4-dehydrorhamnose 3,5-epimerase